MNGLLSKVKQNGDIALHWKSPLPPCGLSPLKCFGFKNFPYQYYKQECISSIGPMVYSTFCLIFLRFVLGGYFFFFLVGIFFRGGFWGVMFFFLGGGVFFWGGGDYFFGGVFGFFVLGGGG